MKITEAIILAGGLGTRLQPVVPGIPKCLARVNGKPFLFYIIKYLQQQGIQRYIFSLGYKHEMVVDYIESLKKSFTTHHSQLTAAYSIEDELLGTGGAIKLALPLTKSKNVFVVNGDTLFKVDLKKLEHFHFSTNAHCTLSLKPMGNFDRYGVVELNDDFSIKNFTEKKYYEEGLINGGVYAFNTARFLEKDLPKKFSFEKDYLQKFYKSTKMFGFVQDEYFIDIGMPEDYSRAQTELVNEVDA
jgi:D-glycero-alpha-D-manno-heptose 1-phosphate guanylyltransferase